MKNKSSVIAGWMESTIIDGGIDRYDDLHIDEIDPIYSNPSSWIEGGLNAFLEAERLSVERGYDVVVAIAFSLESRKHLNSKQVSSELSKQLDWSPPSLYLFRKGAEPWAQVYVDTRVKVEKIKPKHFFGVDVGEQYCCYFIQFMRESEKEYYRVVYAVRCSI